MRKTLSMLVYGEPGMGKTPLALTCPAPRLVLDVEGGTTYAARDVVEWNPAKDGLTPPEAETVRVFVDSFKTMGQVYTVLKGTHPFRSVDLDSITEIQKRCKDAMGKDAFGIAKGGNTFASWGVLLSQMEGLVRGLRDLVSAGSIDVLVITAISDYIKGRYRPSVEGKLAINLPGFMDVVGCLDTFRDVDNRTYRGMLVQDDGEHIAKDRTSTLPSGGLVGQYGDILPAPISITEILDRIF